MPVFHLIAGPNGAGKSTLYRYLIQPRYPQLPFINADVCEREQLGHVRQALKRAEAARVDGAELGGPQLVASVVGGQVSRQASSQPAWVLKVLGA